MRRGPPWLRIALRELSGGLAGFWIYLACLALGAWAIASAGSITSALNAGLDRQSRELLGGDAAVTLSQRAASTEQRAWMEARGVVAEAAQADLMARAPGKISQADVRAIDGNFPLVGSFEFDRDLPLADILARTGDVWGIAASDTLADTEAEQIRRVMAATNGNKSLAAKILGIERKTLYRKLERMGL